MEPILLIKEDDKFLAPGLCPMCQLTLSVKSPRLGENDLIGCTQCCSIFTVDKSRLRSIEQKDLDEMLPMVRHHLKEFAKISIRAKGKLN